MVIFLYGEDEFRSLRKLSELKGKFLEKNKGGFGLDVFDFSDKSQSADEIIMSSESGGLFSKKKLVIVKSFIISKKEPDKLADFLKKFIKNNSADTTLVFWEGSNLDKRNKLFKLLSKIEKSQEFKSLEDAKLPSWIKGEVKALSLDSVSINNSAAQKLVVYVGNNLSLLQKELEKLVAYKVKGEIEEADIELLVKAKIDKEIFETIDALARGDKKLAMKLLNDHLSAGDDPFYLLSMFFYQFRNLVKIKPLAQKNMNQFEISKRLRLHPFVVCKSIDQVRNFSWEKLKKLYQSLCEIDFESKIGKVDVELALDKFVASV
jgi:DNA polymerase III subunit delta